MIRMRKLIWRLLIFSINITCLFLMLYVVVKITDPSALLFVTYSWSSPTWLSYFFISKILCQMGKWPSGGKGASHLVIVDPYQGTITSPEIYSQKCMDVGESHLDHGHYRTNSTIDTLRWILMHNFFGLNSEILSFHYSYSSTFSKE